MKELPATITDPVIQLIQRIPELEIWDFAGACGRSDLLQQARVLNIAMRHLNASLSHDEWQQLHTYMNALLSASDDPDIRIRTLIQFCSIHKSRYDYDAVYRLLNQAEAELQAWSESIQLSPGIHQKLQQQLNTLRRETETADAVHTALLNNIAAQRQRGDLVAEEDYFWQLIALHSGRNDPAVVLACLHEHLMHLRLFHNLSRNISALLQKLVDTYDAIGAQDESLLYMEFLAEHERTRGVARYSNDSKKNAPPSTRA